ncbi:carbohydrate binding domain-containing protein [bacterium]|nr:carbohydrate binding domain-containing protein [bacterium]
MRTLRLVLSFVLVALLALGCRPAPLAVSNPGASVVQPVLKGELLLPGGYDTQATAGQVRANATVTLIDPSTFQAKGTGITASDGSFTVQALGSFTPVLGALYLLESSKALGGTSNAAFRLRTLVQFNAGGWTSVSGTSIRLSTTTTAAAILWDQQALSASDVIGKLVYDPVTGTLLPAALGATAPESLVRSVDGLVGEALALNLDPIQIVRPGPGGTYGLALGTTERNRLLNPSFEDRFSSWQLWDAQAVASYSLETAGAMDGRIFVRATAAASGDVWVGQGYTSKFMALGVKWEAGKTYTFSIFARAARAGDRIFLHANPQTGGATFNGSTISLTTSWQRYSLTFTPTDTTNKGVLVVRLGDKAGQTLYPTVVDLDGAQFEEGAATDLRPQGRLMLDGFGNAFESVGVTPVAGRGGTAVFIDRAVNVLPNSSFEKDADANGIPDGMVRVGSSTATISLDPDALFHGRALKLDKSTGATADYARFNHVYTYEAGKTYTFSVWVKGQNVSGPQSSTDFGIYVDAYLPNAALSSPDVRNVAAPVGTFDWTRVSFSHTFFNTCASASVIPIFRNKSGTVWFDGFQVEQGPKATPYAGEPGQDRLTYDAFRYVSKTQGTIAFWYQPTYSWTDGDFKLLSIDGANSIKWPVLYLSKVGGNLTLMTHGGPGSVWDAGATWTPTSEPWKAGEWHHLAITWGPAGDEIYFDGARVATGPFSGNLNGGSALNLLTFACNDFLNTNIFSVVNPQGALDGLKVWDVQRSPDEIRRAYLGVMP